ncbi:MAG: oxidoreductase molybdopterin binding protein [Armatimonadetes bacterium]|nr:oxidoreductase molybdopterin binding protein [Armatimonadota bacterium]
MSQQDPKRLTPAVRRLLDRRGFVQQAGAGTAIVWLGSVLYGCGSAAPKAPSTVFQMEEPDPRPSADEEAMLRAEPRADGRPRVPPGQRLLSRLREMGGREGDPSPGAFRLRVHGEVKKPLDLDYAELLALPRTEQECDVHCVTGWSLVKTAWTGVRLDELADRAGVKGTARHVIFEAAHGYTANVPIKEALTPQVLVAYRHEGDPLGQPHGAPVRALVPDLYFWKSAKWLTGIRFVTQDEPGYWEVRGYNNHADPWLEERYA